MTRDDPANHADGGFNPERDRPTSDGTGGADTVRRAPNERASTSREAAARLVQRLRPPNAERPAGRRLSEESDEWATSDPATFDTATFDAAIPDPATFDPLALADDGLDHEVRDAHARAAGLARSRFRWIRQQDLEGATFDGMLLDIAERGETVQVTTVPGRSYRGTISAIGRDYISLDSDDRQVFIRVSQIATCVSTGLRSRAVTGDRSTTWNDHLVEQFALATGRRPRVTVWTSGPVSASGVLVACGTDVCTVIESPTAPISDVPSRATVSVQLSTVSELVMFRA